MGCRASTSPRSSTRQVAPEQFPQPEQGRDGVGRYPVDVDVGGFAQVERVEHAPPLTANGGAPGLYSGRRARPCGRSTGMPGRGRCRGRAGSAASDSCRPYSAPTPAPTRQPVLADAVDRVRQANPPTAGVPQPGQPPILHQRRLLGGEPASGGLHPRPGPITAELDPKPDPARSHRCRP